MTLNEWMTVRGLDDNQVAKLLDDVVKRSQVWRIRTGESAPTLKTARALEKLTGIPAMHFLSKQAGDPTAKKPRATQARAA